MADLELEGVLMKNLKTAYCAIVFILFAALGCADAADSPAGAALPAQDKPALPGQKKVLIVTGMDYPGHLWRKTTPVLRDAVGKDQRLHVTVTEDAKFLASPDLKNFDVILLHYMNWQNPGPGAEAQEGLRKAVENGTGLVMVHFACGAFQGWPEFVKIAGRVMDITDVNCRLFRFYSFAHPAA